MERLTIEEVIEHCNKTCDMTEKIAKSKGRELESIESNQFWEHYQVRAWLKELKQYKNLEEQGLLLRLPCKVGDIVYRIINQRDNYDDTVYQIVSSANFELSMIDEIGKTVFLTKAEADWKLKDMVSY